MGPILSFKNWVLKISYIVCYESTLIHDIPVSKETSPKSSELRNKLLAPYSCVQSFWIW